MSATNQDTTLDPVLEAARASGTAAGLNYAGAVHPADAWRLFESGELPLVDIRSAEERKFVGHVPGTLHVAWATGTSLVRNPRFLRELEAKVGKEGPVLLLCRSGKRSAEAAALATANGFRLAFNVREGFEGDLDERKRRGTSNGWRFHDLPWVQD